MREATIKLMVKITSFTKMRSKMSMTVPFLAKYSKSRQRSRCRFSLISSLKSRKAWPN